MMELEQLRAAGFMRPAYGGGCFADIPHFMRAVLTGAPSPITPAGWAEMPQRYQRVIALFVDAFGWRFFDKFQDHPLLQRFVRKGSVNQLTSQFPSTTSAHVTTLYTGQTVGQHGVFEWFYYEPEVDRVIGPLLYSYADDKGRETLATANIAPERILPQGLLASELAAAGVSTVAFQPREFAFSTYTSRMGAGAQLVPYYSLPEALVNLRQLLGQQHGPACFVLYTGTFDSICHIHGPSSPQAELELLALLDLLERWFVQEVEGQLDDTLLMLFADHGQIEVDPQITRYLDLLPVGKPLTQLLRRNRQGQVIAPAGSWRDYFVYAEESALDDAEGLLREALDGYAAVVRTATLAEAGFFGPEPVSATFAARASNLVVLPYGNGSVFWSDNGRFGDKFRGHHGGLTPAEMQIPLLLHPLQG